MEKQLAKDYYKSYEASNEILRPHFFLANTILEFNPKSIFEFGCGSGKNLKLLKTLEPKVATHGIDVSLKNISNSHEINFLDCCHLGDENSLSKYPSSYFDVVFTCSVLDHIENIELIVKQFERIAKKAIVLFETNDISKRYPYHYYPHNYEDLGFRKTNFVYLSNEASDADGCEYGLWIKNLV